MLESMINAFRAPDIRRRLLFVLGMLIIYRALGHVLLPGINPGALGTASPNNGFFDLLSLFSGSDIRRLSVIGLGLNPYINATIIMQILQTTIPSLQALSREGEYGRNKITSYSRWLSVPLAALQAYGILALINNTSGGAIFTTPFAFETLETTTQIVCLTAGSVLLMWMGELITEKGIGNGISFIIFAGIVSRVPGTLSFVVNNPNWIQLIAFGVVAVIVIWVIIFVQEGQRRIPIQYANRVRGHRIYQGGSTFLPLRVNMSGVIPIIFAVSILLFPIQLASYFQGSSVGWLRDFSNWIIRTLNTNPPSVWYISLYFLLTLAFGFFYTFVVFKPKETADNLRKQGGFILGIRPGRPTEEYLSRVVLRITLAGAIFLAIVAVLPMAIAGLPWFSSLSGIGIGLGGTSVLIVVSVVIETMKQLEAQLMMRSYEGFIR